MKKISALIASSLLVVLAACSSGRKDPSTSSSGQDDPAATVQLGAFESKAVNITLEPNESKDLEVLVFPSAFKTKNVKYVSSDSSIAEVSASGKITAKKAGNAKITVSCGTFSTVCYVDVGSKVNLEDGTQKAALVKGFKETKAMIDDPSFVQTDYLKIKEKSHSEVYRTEKETTKKIYDSMWYEDMIVSKEDAYFSIYDSYDSKSRVADGATSYSTSGWIFYCTESFETFIFHDSNEGKKYMVIDCSAHSDRYAALTEVLANIFSNVTDIIANQFDNINTSEECDMIIDCLEHDYSNVVWNQCYTGDADKHQLKANYAITYENELIDPSSSSSANIPSGVYADITIGVASYFSEAYMQYQDIEYIYEYDYRNAHYSDRSYIDRGYTLEKEELRYPDIKKEGWKEAEDIFEL